ncbi:MAG: hypothetical protein WKG07_42170 [Hymenobacter sp.]
MKSANLRSRIDGREAEALAALELLEELDTRPELTELRGLRAWRKQHALDPTPSPRRATELPFKVFEDHGFTILVGRNAQNNDLLTQKYAHKDDLWLHAKDVSGLARRDSAPRRAAGAGARGGACRATGRLVLAPPARLAVPGHGHAQEIRAQAQGCPARPGGGGARARGARGARQSV